MSLYTLEELNNKPADIIRSLLLEGYRIVPTEQTNKMEFVAVLNSNHYTVEIITRCNYDRFTINIIAKHYKNSKFDFEESRLYYKAYNDIYYNEVYSDSEKEAEDERLKYRTKCYEDMYLSGNFHGVYKEFPR